MRRSRETTRPDLMSNMSCTRCIEYGLSLPILDNRVWGRCGPSRKTRKLSNVGETTSGLGEGPKNRE